MPNMTLAVPEELHSIMKKHTEVRWSEVARQAMLSHVQKLELLDRITSKSKLTQKDVMEIDSKIKKGVFEKFKKAAGK